MEQRTKPSHVFKALVPNIIWFFYGHNVFVNLIKFSDPNHLILVLNAENELKFFIPGQYFLI